MESRPANNRPGSSVPTIPAAETGGHSVSLRRTFLIPPGGSVRSSGVTYFTDHQGKLMRTTKLGGWAGVLLMTAVVSGCEDSAPVQQTPVPESQVPDIMKTGKDKPLPKMPAAPAGKTP
jgi:hypothetical protein